jgi:hypothetical protein
MRLPCNQGARRAWGPEMVRCNLLSDRELDLLPCMLAPCARTVQSFSCATERARASPADPGADAITPSNPFCLGRETVSQELSS